MATANLLALIEDITTVLDQVAAASKAAAKKTAGVVADDMALNAQQVTGVDSSRELPVVWAVARGSLLNKLAIIPTLLLISALAPKAVKVLLLVGGLFLCFEGFEKVAHKLLHSADDDEASKQKHIRDVADPAVDLVQAEKDKIKGAIRTDFILSAEISVIALGAVSTASMGVQVATLAVVGLAMTVGVYGLVAGIVRFDDLGLWLLARAGDTAGARLSRALGRAILRATPWIMRALSFLGTTAMFLVGGSIVAHGVAPAHHAVEALVSRAGTAAPNLARSAGELAVGLLAGALCVLLVTVGARVKRALSSARASAT